MCTWRGKVRNTVPISEVLQVYGLEGLLGSPDELVLAISELVKDGNYRYPGSWKVCHRLNHSGSSRTTLIHVKNKKYVEENPFLHDAIILILYHAFFGPKAVTTFPDEYFLSDVDGEPELPDAMIAFGALLVGTHL